MSEIRDDRQYTKTHEWVIDNGDGTFTLGITDHAQELLGDMVFLNFQHQEMKFQLKVNFVLLNLSKQPVASMPHLTLK